jgi:hypothetical protein
MRSLLNWDFSHSRSAYGMEAHTEGDRTNLDVVGVEGYGRKKSSRKTGLRDDSAHRTRPAT